MKITHEFRDIILVTEDGLEFEGRETIPYQHTHTSSGNSKVAMTSTIDLADGLFISGFKDGVFEITDEGGNTRKARIK